MPPWDPAQSEPVIVLSAVTVLYVIYYYATNAKVWSAVGPPGPRAEWGPSQPFILQRASGFILLGLIPALIAQLGLTAGLSGSGLALGSVKTGAMFVAGTLVLVLPIIIVNARRPKMWAHYPQIRNAVWTQRLHMKNTLSWALYLLGYEFFFRGFLLMNMERWLGPWPAIAITTALYVWAHLPKNAAETIGCIPMGVVFCAAALLTGGFWPAFVIHVSIAVTSDIAAQHYAPNQAATA